MPYLGKSPEFGVRERFYFTQTSAGATSVSGFDDNGTSLRFTDGNYVDVYLNGVLLVDGVDYGTSTANTISSLSALADEDVIEIVVYDVFNLAKNQAEVTRTRYYKTASGSETSISGNDDSGVAISFPAGAQLDVSLNGVSLVAGTDYNTSTANTISGLSALSAGQVIEIVKYEKFVVSDTVSKAAGGTFSGNVTMGGTLAVTGVITPTAGFATSASANFSAGSTLIVPTANGIPSWANEITVSFYNLSRAGTAPDIFTGYANGSAYTTNYEYMSIYYGSGGNTVSDRSAGSDGGVSFYAWNQASNTHSGTVTFTHTTGNEYTVHGQMYVDTQPTFLVALVGRVSFPSPITGIQISNSTNFDSGQVRVLWR